MRFLSSASELGLGRLLTLYSPSLWNRNTSRM